MLIILAAFLFLWAKITLTESIVNNDDPTLQSLLLAVVRDELLPSLDTLTDKSRNIPRSVWIPKCIKPPQLPETLLKMKELNPDWKFHLQDCNQQEEFMSKYFANTSVLAAYNLINPILRSPRTDIYRFSVLYTFGGVYMDYDAHVIFPLDSFIYNNDSLLLSHQRGAAYSNLYNESYHLSKTGVISTEVFPLFNTLVQWMIVSKPRNKIILRTLENLIELVRLEYKKQSALIDEMKDSLMMQIFLVVGPMMFTATVREVLLNESILSKDDKAMRVYKKAEFQEVGAHHLMTRTYAAVIKARANSNEETKFLTKYYT